MRRTAVLCFVPRCGLGCFPSMAESGPKGGPCLVLSHVDTGSFAFCFFSFLIHFLKSNVSVVLFCTFMEKFETRDLSAVYIPWMKLGSFSAKLAGLD